jgi:hypothetical protein
MEEKAFIKYVFEYFKLQNVATSSTAIDSLTSPSYLNPNLLQTLARSTIYKNADKILDEVMQTYRKRTKGAVQETKVRDVDVRPVLKKRYCSMPPFCKDK